MKLWGILCSCLVLLLLLLPLYAATPPKRSYIDATVNEDLIDVFAHSEDETPSVTCGAPGEPCCTAADTSPCNMGLTCCSPPDACAASCATTPPPPVGKPYKIINKVGIPQATIFVTRTGENWANPSAFICKLLTGADGKAHYTIPDALTVDTAKGCTLFTFTLCNNITDPNLLAQCLRIEGVDPVTHKGTGVTIPSIDETQIGWCNPAPASPPNKNLRDAAVGQFYSAQTMAQYCKGGEFNFTNVNSAFCLPLLVIVGLLMGGMFLTGRNPLASLDFSSPRMGRGKQYQMRQMNKSLYLTSIGGTLIRNVMAGVKGKVAGAQQKKALKKEEAAGKKQAATAQGKIDAIGAGGKKLDRNDRREVANLRKEQKAGQDRSDQAGLQMTKLSMQKRRSILGDAVKGTIGSTFNPMGGKQKGTGGKGGWFGQLQREVKGTFKAQIGGGQAAQMQVGGKMISMGGGLGGVVGSGADLLKGGKEGGRAFRTFWHIGDSNFKGSGGGFKTMEGGFKGLLQGVDSKFLGIGGLAVQVASGGKQADKAVKQNTENMATIKSMEDKRSANPNYEFSDKEKTQYADALNGRGNWLGATVQAGSFVVDKQADALKKAGVIDADTADKLKTAAKNGDFATVVTTLTPKIDALKASGGDTKGLEDMRKTAEVSQGAKSELGVVNPTLAVLQNPGISPAALNNCLDNLNRLKAEAKAAAVDFASDHDATKMNQTTSMVTNYVGALDYVSKAISSGKINADEGSRILTTMNNAIKEDIKNDHTCTDSNMLLDRAVMADLKTDLANSPAPADQAKLIKDAEASMKVFDDQRSKEIKSEISDVRTAEKDGKISHELAELKISSLNEEDKQNRQSTETLQNLREDMTSGAIDQKTANEVISRVGEDLAAASSGDREAAARLENTNYALECLNKPPDATMTEEYKKQEAETKEKARAYLEDPTTVTEVKIKVTSTPVTDETGNLVLNEKGEAVPPVVTKESESVTTADEFNAAKKEMDKFDAAVESVKSDPDKAADKFQKENNLGSVERENYETKKREEQEAAQNYLDKPDGTTKVTVDGKETTITNSDAWGNKIGELNTLERAAKESKDPNASVSAAGIEVPDNIKSDPEVQASGKNVTAAADAYLEDSSPSNKNAYTAVSEAHTKLVFGKLFPQEDSAVAPQTPSSGTPGADTQPSDTGEGAPRANASTERTSYSTNADVGGGRASGRATSSGEKGSDKDEDTEGPKKRKQAGAGDSDTFA